MSKNLVIISLILCIAIVFCFSKSINSALNHQKFKKSPGAVCYNLKNPSEVHVLPKELKEVSGVTNVSKNEVGCVQDEKGIVFVYNLKEKKVVKKIHFARDADYEGISFANNSFFVMRSNGIIHEVKFPWENPTVETKSLKLPTWNNEGLCYDKKNNRLLIAPKSKLEEKNSIYGTLPIYTYDLEKKSLNKKPLFCINTAKILDHALKYKLSTPGQKASKKVIKFRPSSIAIHPKTDEIYILSAKGNVLVVFDQLGKIKGYSHLDKRIFNHPEGLTFLKNGDMVVTNEGDKKKPTLLRFPWYKG